MYLSLCPQITVTLDCKLNVCFMTFSNVQSLNVCFTTFSSQPSVNFMFYDFFKRAKLHKIRMRTPTKFHSENDHRKQLTMWILRLGSPNDNEYLQKNMTTVLKETGTNEARQLANFNLRSDLAVLRADMLSIVFGCSFFIQGFLSAGQRFPFCCCLWDQLLHSLSLVPWRHAHLHLEDRVGLMNKN